MRNLVATTSLALVLASGIAGSAFAQDYPEMSVRYANFMPEGFTTSVIDQFVADEIAKRTDGKVKFEMFHGGTLGGPAEMVELVGAGAVDIGNFPIGYFFSQFPVSGLADSLPIIFPNAEAAAQVQKDAYAALEEVRAEFDAANLHPFLYRGLPQYRLLCTKPVKTLADFDGLKVRTYGTFHPIVFTTFKAVPVNIELGEMYEGLQRGTVDCAYLNYQTAVLYNLFEVAKFTSDAEFGATPLYLAYVNKQVWDSWTPEFQALFNEVVDEAEKKAADEIEATEASGLEALKAKGVELVHFEDQEKMEEALPDFLDLWVEHLDKAGHGEAAKKHADFVRERLKAYAQ
ncbi:MAG: C4-dicarboxylate TRAP transporter substrate-binding protein [Aquamicrobium sp.]|uniref:C4-dicarboxylate TRAP transporter substrate-binding protein n=1 Tax=Aquamicrobium sp. TaxID=1872579 RepID=UPI00349EC5EF|nr:C4-dicarboxylate TRAP transporter substrate-binding protein [Aquamicrobium sp.]